MRVSGYRFPSNVYYMQYMHGKYNVRMQYSDIYSYKCGRKTSNLCEFIIIYRLSRAMSRRLRANGLKVRRKWEGGFGKKGVLTSCLLHMSIPTLSLICILKHVLHMKMCVCVCVDYLATCQKDESMFLHSAFPHMHALRLHESNSYIPYITLLRWW